MTEYELNGQRKKECKVIQGEKKIELNIISSCYSRIIKKKKKKLLVSYFKCYNYMRSIVEIILLLLPIIENYKVNEK